MQVRLVDPRDMHWEQAQPLYRVYFWDRPQMRSHEFEIAEADVEDVLTWAQRKGEETRWTYTVYVVTAGAAGSLGMIRLSGVSGDPFA